MATIEKLMISGIRSYSPGEPSVIEFQTPLTLIVGPNGTGKTSIIESLKYITTGDLPPGCTNSAFIHDPKIAGEREVKGQVRLSFRDVTGTKIQCTRSMTSTQKEKKIETKSIDGVICKTVNGERISISSRCTDFTKEMVSRLGVSKAILDNVIFCHQEDASWPLSEGKTLKQKFDDIFASTRYIKALENMRNLRKEQTELVKNFNIDLHHLKRNKDKSDEISEELRKSTVKAEAVKDHIKKLDAEITPLQVKLKEQDAIAGKVVELERKISNMQSVRKELQTSKAKLRERIENVMEGSSEELQAALQDFHGKVASKERNLVQLEGHLQTCNRECEKLAAERSELLQLRGKLQQEAQSQQKNIMERDQLIVELAEQQKFNGFDTGPFDAAQITEFLLVLKNTYQSIVETTKAEKAKCNLEILDYENKIDALKKSHHEREMAITQKNEQFTSNQEKLRQIDQQLQNLNASVGRIETLDAEIRQRECDIADTKASFSAAALNAEIDELVAKRSSLSNELSQLREAQNRMHLQSKAQTKIELLRKEKDTKENAISKIFGRHDSDLQAMFGRQPSADEVRSCLAEFLESKRDKLRMNSSELQEKTAKMTSIEAKKKLYEEQLAAKEQEASQYRQQMSEACGENDLNNTIEEIRTDMDDVKHAIAELSAFSKTYEKYVATMRKDKIEHNNGCCPLCLRAFASLQELTDLVNKLETKLASVPGRHQSSIRTLNEKTVQLREMESLMPVKTNLERLETDDIPELRRKCTLLSGELRNVKAQVNDLTDARCLLDDEEKVARGMESDIHMLDSYHFELRTLDRNIHLETAKLQGIAPGRTMQAVTKDIQEKQEQHETANRRIEQKRNHLMETERQLGNLERSLNQISSEKLELTAKLQARSRLEEQKAELGADSEACRRDMREARKQLGPIKSSLDEHVEKKASLVSQLESNVERVRHELQKLKLMGNRIREKTAEVNKYIDNDKASELEHNDLKLATIKKQTEEIEQRKAQLVCSIQELTEDVAKQKVREREIHDNLSLHEIEKRLTDETSKISNIRKELEQHGALKNHATERLSLQNKLDSLRKDRANSEGRLGGIHDSIRHFQKELRSSQYAGADEKHRNKLIEVKTTELANQDLDKYYKALDRAIMRFHGIKMKEINQIIKDYWMKTYSGNDIDTIEIRADEEEGNATAKRRQYKYRLVMIKGGTPMDMRSRCSAGQKVLASIIIRLALAETFCLHCGILALDEPTTNLDENNIESLANALKGVITSRQQQRNFQMIIITHDEEFVHALGRSEYVDYYFRVYKDEAGHSRIHRQSTSEIEEGH